MGRNDDSNRLADGLSIDLMEVFFVRLRVISWIESLPTAGDRLNHTKHHEMTKFFVAIKK